MFADESIERRHARDARRADHKRDGQPWKDAAEAAETLQIALASKMNHAADAEKQQAFKEGVIDNMQKRGGHAERRSDAETCQNIADLRNRMPREQQLAVGLR